MQQVMNKSILLLIVVFFFHFQPSYSENFNSDIRIIRAEINRDNLTEAINKLKKNKNFKRK